MKIHVCVDVSTKQILALKITHEQSHDGQRLPYLAHQASPHGRIVKAFADPAYDSGNNFSYLYHDDVVPAIKVIWNNSI